MKTARAISALVVAALMCAGIDALFTEEVASADPPLRETYGVSFVCPPHNLFNPDAGSTVNGLVTCPGGYRAVKVEVLSTETNKAYICAQTGTTRANYTSACFERCPTCTYGGQYTVDAYQGLTRCLSNSTSGNDAGVKLVVQCGR